MLKLSFKTCDTQKAGTVGTHFVGGEGGGVNTGTRTLNIEFVGPHASCPLRTPELSRSFGLCVWATSISHPVVFRSNSLPSHTTRPLRGTCASGGKHGGSGHQCVSQLRVVSRHIATVPFASHMFALCDPGAVR